MKIKKLLAVITAISMLILPSCAGTTGPSGGEDNTDLAGTYNITLWVSEKEGIAEQFAKQIDAFEAANPGVVINAQIEGVAEGDSGSKVLADVATAPDIYSFAQDQLVRLVQAAALVAPGKAAAETIRAENDAGAVAAATVGNTLWAYPMTSDNGYFMYYDTSIISEEDAEDMSKIIAACERSGKKFRFALENAWYTASFFFGAGCKSVWTIAEDGTSFSSVDDDFNSEKGLVAMRAMRELTRSRCYDNNADVFTDAAVVVTGIWNAGAAKAYFGENMGATDLPSFTVDGKSYHLGSFSGNKLMGVKPQSDPKRAAVLSKLALYLTGEECQTQRFESFEWGPSNINAQKSEAVQSNISLAALAKQNAHGTPQGQIHGAWWDITRVLGADAKNAKNDDDLKRALESYKKAVDAAVRTPDPKA
ncbi:MAG: extracellular solute-binding protein [Eubacteriales bacterium]